MRGLLATLVLCVALAAPAAPALAQAGPFTPLPPGPVPAPTPPPGPGGAASEDDGLSGWQTTLILIGAAFLLGGIAVAIVLDAREKARAGGSRGAAPTDPGQRDPRRERAKQQTRRKQRAARAQRRRNR